MNVLFFIVSIASGALVGHASWIRNPQKNLGKVGNIAIGMLGGASGWFLLKQLGWYTGEWNLAFEISALLGYMCIGSVTSGLLLILFRNLFSKQR